MKAYILSIAGIVLLSAVVTIIAPAGKMGKFIKGTTRLFILVVMLSPLIGWVKGERVSLADPAKMELDGGYLAACARRLEEEDEEKIAGILMEDFGVSGEIDAERAECANFPLKKITVILGGGGIFPDSERIYMISQVKARLEADFGVTAEVS